MDLMRATEIQDKGDVATAANLPKTRGHGPQEGTRRWQVFAILAMTAVGFEPTPLRTGA